MLYSPPGTGLILEYSLRKYTNKVSLLIESETPYNHYKDAFISVIDD